MRRFDSRLVLGIVLIAGGVLFLLDNLGVLPGGDLFWTVILGLGGIFFLSIAVQNRANWWALIPGTTLLGVALQAGLDVLAPQVADKLGGTIVLGGISLGFALIYLLDRQQWWAIIPFGVLGTLAAFVAAEELFGLDSPGLFFFGIGLTFALVAVLPNREGDMRWAWIPAGILLLVGVFVTAASGDLLAYLWPVALIGVGLFLVARTFLKH